VGVATLLAAAATVSPASAARARYGISTEHLAPGLDLTRINDNSDPNHPEQIRVLTVDPSKPLTLDTTLAGASLPGRARTSTMGSTNGALAAINGDFNVDPGTPLHNFAADGSAVMTGFQNGASFAISKDEAHTYVESARMRVEAQNLTTGKKFGVVQWNHGDPQADDIDGYTKLGGSADRPPTGGCFVRLLRAGKMHWAALQQGVYRDYKVQVEKCQSKRMGFRKGALILASNHNGGLGASTLHHLVRGTKVRLTWDMVGTAPWTGVMDVVGGMPLLVNDGVNVAKTCSSYFCSRNPRTGIGITADGKILLVTVDGRAPGVSVGMTLIGFADEMKSLGATYAVNLDGGGSTTMWVAGDGVVNRPSDSSGERYVTNAVMVLPGADATEPTPVLGPLVADPSVLAAADHASSLEDADPGSTGGLMDAIASGDLGGGTDLPPALRQLAASFRATR
jgi:hypothetical protein